MWWLYLDESGDLGFDFVNTKPSRFFTVCVLATSHKETDIAFRTAIKRTLRHKLNPPGKRSRMVDELKAASTTLAVKQYAWKQVADRTFGIYCLTLNKRKVYAKVAADKDRVYNYVARLVIDRVPFEKADSGVQLIVDKSKGRRQIEDFNLYIERQLKGRVAPEVPLHFIHGDSRKWPGLQLADLFAWGVFAKYERRDSSWFDCYREKVRFEELFL
jgi:hypothetical protein